LKELIEQGIEFGILANDSLYDLAIGINNNLGGESFDVVGIQ
jgi:hypothetical protein